MNFKSDFMQKDISTCMSEMDDENYCSFCKRIVEVHTDFRGGYRVCLSCGVVLQERIIDTTEEYRLFADDNKGDGHNPIRVGAAYNFKLPDGGLDLKIEGGKRKKDKVLEIFHYKMKRINNEGYNYSSAYFRGSKLIRQWSEHLSLPPVVVTKAEDLYSTMKQEKKTFKGLSVENLAAAFIWIACREHNHIMEFSSLEATTDIPADEIKKTYHLIMRSTELPKEGAAKKPTTYAESYAKQLGLSDETCALIGRFEANLTERGTLEGKNPKTIAGVCVYIVCSLSGKSGEARSWKEVAKIVELTEATLKKSYKALGGGELEKVLPKWEGMKSISTLKGL